MPPPPPQANVYSTCGGVCALLMPPVDANQTLFIRGGGVL